MAQLNLGSDGAFSQRPIKALVDTSVLRASELAQPQNEVKTIHFGEIQQDFAIAGFERKRLPPQDQDWKRDQLLLLPTIRKLAQFGRIQFFTYNELQFETWHGASGRSLSPKGDMLHGIEITRIESAIERSFLQQSSLEQHITKNAFVEFIEFLLKLTPDLVLQLTDVLRNRMPQGQLNNLSRLTELRLLCEIATRKSYPDAYHLWTAQCAGIDAFLTLDRRFSNAINGTRNAPGPSRPISPAQLVAILGADKLEPMPMEMGRFYSLLEM